MCIFTYIYNYDIYIYVFIWFYYIIYIVYYRYTLCIWGSILPAQRVLWLRFFDSSGNPRLVPNSRGKIRKPGAKETDPKGCTTSEMESTWDKTWQNMINPPEVMGWFHDDFMMFHGSPDEWGWFHLEISLTASPWGAAIGFADLWRKVRTWELRIAQSFPQALEILGETNARRLQNASKMLQAHIHISSHHDLSCICNICKHLCYA